MFQIIRTTKYLTYRKDLRLFIFSDTILLQLLVGSAIGRLKNRTKMKNCKLRLFELVGWTFSFMKMSVNKVYADFRN